MMAKHVSNSPVTIVTRERFAVLWRKLTNYKGLALKIGSLSNSVFERRTSTGSGLFASLGSGSVETLG